MAKSVDKITLLLDLKGFKAVKGLGQDFNKFKSTVRLSANEVDKAIKGLTKYHGNTKLSTNALKGQISALTRLKDNVGINTKAYKSLSAALEQAKNKMNQLTGASKQQQRFKFLGAGGRAALGGAVGRFLPGSAQIGGIAGFAEGGFKGAVKGAGIGLAVDAVAGGVQFAKQAAQQASQVQKLEIALRGAVKTEADFQKGLEIIANTSKTLNVPIAASTKQFTTLAASVIGAGGSIEDAKVVFEGVSNSIKATGGNAEDVQSAIRAMSQIFGKGKVSAEELQGQLGERLAGAVVKFAEANGSSLQKLQKDLRDGTVGLDQVIKFAQKLNIDFADTAKKVANSSADAGQRLQTQFNNFSITVGKAIIPVGAAFQKMFSDILNGLQENKGAMDLFIGSLKLIGAFAFATVASVRFLTRTLIDLAKILFNIANFRFKEAFEVAQKGLKDTAENAKKDGKAILDIFKGTQTIEGKEDDTSGVQGLPKLTEDATAKSKQIFSKYVTDIADVTKDIQNLFVNTFKKIEDSLVDFITTGTINFRKFAQDIVREMTRIFVRGAIMKPLTQSFENLISPKKETTAKTKNKATSIFDFAQSFDFPSDFFTKKSDIPFMTSIPKGVSAEDILPNVKTVVMPNVKVDDILQKEGFNTSVLEGILDIESGRRDQVLTTPTIRKSTFGDKFGAFTNRFLDFFDSRFADGGVIPKNKIVPTRYAKGGLIERPTLFPLANGAALAGEAGVEAIMPLRRGRDGRLGVETSGGVGNVTVNVDASGSSAEGDEQKSTELGKVLGAAIQAELVKQKRPGGLLA